ncbi:MAG: CPBP family glutamic-type intramembrane protease [Acidimicrobiia bacterium]
MNALAVALGVVAVGNLLSNRLVPKWAYVPNNVAIAIALVVCARLGGVLWSELGFARGWIRRGRHAGGLLAAATFVVYLVGAILPATRDLFHDRRVDTAGLVVLYQALIRIPLGTVLLEETAFRGVLPALFRKAGFSRGDLAASFVFGLWHILPALSLSTVNPKMASAFQGASGHVLTVAGAVAATTVAGLLLCWLRSRTQSLLTPAIVHVATNSLGYLFAYLVTRG